MGNSARWFQAALIVFFAGAVDIQLLQRILRHIVDPIKPYTALARLAVLLVLSAARRLV